MELNNYTINKIQIRISNKIQIINKITINNNRIINSKILI
jgi:hypothetical protein